MDLNKPTLQGNVRFGTQATPSTVSQNTLSTASSSPSTQGPTLQGRAVGLGEGLQIKAQIQELTNVPEQYLCPVTHELMEEPYWPQARK